MVKQRHHDGHGLNDLVVIVSDPRDDKAGRASHKYKVFFAGKIVADIQFQHGPRSNESSKRGLLDEAILAILLDRFDGFLEGPYSCAETIETHKHLTAALDAIKKRANDRAARNVLGRNEK